jgi:tRNA(Ile)-lysidine synthase
MNSIDKNARDLILKVKKWISAEELIIKGDRVLCGLSGGADSVAMLLILESLKTELGFELRAAHVNHMLRGAEAERDADFCRELCARKNIAFSLLRGDAARLAREKKLGLEEAARDLRYALLKDERISLGFNKIATAHNADDNLETVLINLSRGAALRGISGISPVNGDIIRPILPLTKKETVSLVSEFGESFVLDSSNETDFCRRNKIRHNVIPLLLKFNPDVSAAVLENGLILRKEDEYLRQAAQDAQKGLYTEDGFGVKDLRA